MGGGVGMSALTAAAAAAAATATSVRLLACWLAPVDYQPR